MLVDYGSFVFGFALGYFGKPYVVDSLENPHFTPEMIPGFSMRLKESRQQAGSMSGILPMYQSNHIHKKISIFDETILSGECGEKLITKLMKQVYEISKDQVNDLDKLSSTVRLPKNNPVFSSFSSKFLKSHTEDLDNRIKKATELYNHYLMFLSEFFETRYLQGLLPKEPSVVLIDDEKL